MQCLYNNNGNSNLTASGNYCTLLAPAVGIGALASGNPSSIGPDLAASSAAGYQVPMLENVSYYLGPNATGAGSVTFQSLEMDGTGSGGSGQWRTLAAPAAITITASTPANGTLAGPFLGIRINLGGSVAGATYARLSASVRTGSL